MTPFAVILRSFVTFRRIPAKIVVSTAAASALLALGMYVMGQPLYMIALYGLLPWVPVMFFEGLWKIDHFHWIAIFAVITLLQLGHVLEHLTQTGALVFSQASLVCPPPVDSEISAQRMIAAGLRDPQTVATGMSASVIVKADAHGAAARSSDGQLISGPPACGIFGQLDLEIVHLVWEMVGWLLTLALLTHYRYNQWLWFSLFWATIHTFEHLFISYSFFLKHPFMYEGALQIWGTLASGNIVTAYPLGLEPATLTFYDVGGKFGLAAKNGLIGTFMPSLNTLLPTRPFLHLYYNLLVTLPGLVAFLQEMRRTYDHYLRKSLPALTTKEMVAVTPVLEYLRYPPGQVIIEEGEKAEHFYILTKGEVSVSQKGQDGVINSMFPNDFFGEIGLMRDGRRHATVRAVTRVEVIRMDQDTFNDLMNHSQLSREQVENIIRERTAHHETQQQMPVEAS